MTLRYEDFNLYYQHTYVLMDDKLHYIHGVRDADAPTTYTVSISPLENGEFGQAKDYPARNLLLKFKSFVPAYGYINYGGFAVLATLGAYRMARKAFSLGRVEFTVPNSVEFNKFMALKRTNRESWFSLPVLVEWLERPTYMLLKPAVQQLYEGTCAGCALSQDFALCSFANKTSLGLFYKSLEIGEVSKDGDIEFNKQDSEFLQGLFQEQVGRQA